MLKREWRPFLILVVFCVCIWNLSSVNCFRFNLDRCRICSDRNDVRCRMQQMNFNCFPGYDKDIWKSEKWPGSARDLRAQVNRKENGELMVADFRWKPPHDSSVDELTGFQIQVNVQEDTSISHPVCFFANLSGTNWTQLPNIHDIDFIFNCVESSEIAKVTVYVTSVPMPSKKHKRITAELVMIPGYSWKPEIRIWTTLSHNSYQVHLWFSPLYPGAEYHKVQLHSDRHENSTDLQAPLGNFTFENVPCEKNYTIQIRPYDNQKALLDHYFSSKTVAVGDCVATVSRQSDPVVSKLVTLISIPVLLVVVGTITGFFFFRRDTVDCKLRRHYSPADSSETTPNNADCTIVLPVFCDDSLQLRNAVHCLKNLIHAIRGCKAQFAEENLMEGFSSDYLKSNSFYQVAIISSKSLIQIYAALEKNRSQVPRHLHVHNNGNLSRESQAFLNCVSSLDNIHTAVASNQQRIKKPILISFFPDIETSILNPDIQEQFVLSDVVDVNGNVQCIIRDAEIRKLVNFLHDNDETLLHEEFGSSRPEAQNFCESLRNLYKMEMRNIPNKGLEESIKTYIGEGESERRLVNNRETVMNYHIPAHGDRRCIDVNPAVWPMLQCNPKETVFDPYDIQFHHHTYIEGEVSLPNSRIHPDSGYVSLVQSDQERCFFTVGNVADFIPPLESDTDSVDNQSLCQKMLEFNQRNLTKWNAVNS